MRNTTPVLCILGLLSFAGYCIAQQSTPAVGTASTRAQTNADCLKGSVKTLRGILKSPESHDDKKLHVIDLITRWPVHICYLDTNATVRPQLIGRAEPKRLDKQPGANSTAAGTTSLVNKGSTPWLFGFAMEHGGLTQDTDGNTMSFRGNVVKSIRAMRKTTYVESYDLGEHNLLITSLAKLSFGVSFDTSGSQGQSSLRFLTNKNSFSGVGATYALYNHRDPRDKKWRANWDQLSATAGANLAAGLGNLDEAVRRTESFAQWRDTQADKIVDIPPDAADAQLQAALADAINTAETAFGQVQEVQAAVSRFKSSAIPLYLQEEDRIFGDIKRSSIVTLNYNFARQNAPANPSLAPTQPAHRLPELSSMTLVLERGFAGPNSPELTFNASGTWFSSSTAGQGRFRDYRASLQCDIPLREIRPIGRPALSFSGQYLRLLREPLGQAVMSNGVAVSRTGGIGVFQSKFSVPIKDSGISLPISFTYSNRTELVKEKDMRGNIGITFDFDSLFAKTK